MLVRCISALRPALVVLALLCLWTPARAQAPHDVFTVRDVVVDITAGNAAAARDEAIPEAQRKAFRTLYERLTLPRDANRLPTLGPAEIEALVEAFEVQEERTSAVRYVGTYTVRFRPSAVRTLMIGAGIPYAEVQAKPLLVLAVDHTLGDPILWQQETAWRRAWADLPLPDGLLPIVIPYGELQDVTDIGVSEALAGDVTALRRIADRYGAGSVAVVQAGLKGILEMPPPAGLPPADPGARPAPVPALPPASTTAGAPPAGAHDLRVIVTLHHFDGAPEISVLDLPPAPVHHPDAPAASASAESPAAAPPPGIAEAMPEAVRQVVERLEQAWVQANLVETGHENRLAVTVPLSGLQDWAETRRRLGGVPTITHVRIVSLARDRAELELTCLGDTARLRTALAQQDLLLTEEPATGPFDAPSSYGGPPVAEPGAAMPAGAAPAPVWRLVWRGSPLAAATPAADPARSPQPTVPGAVAPSP
ncbi:DUF2066 domain-containing protein [Rhodospirillum centenum]|uniref:DUF2066 domain-containing protein n=1 Tax=Rhodospirillum centenum (strain ATCC 51521 / SW) TaxID=414684 RepID=B6IN56_RHOCS|nr:DUF2066 domain-containing protein [Rhodospirillum centenum]ACI98953.1 conserved hypothetical protein [Rhodospirillum centenum SW]